MIDSHCHFDLSAFDGLRQQALTDCAESGVTTMLVPGLSIEQFRFLQELQAQYSLEHVADAVVQIDIALGLHPYFLAQLSSQEQAKQHETLIDLGHQYKNQIVAIGECGLDATLAIDMSYQSKILTQHIGLAKELNKPLVLHHRKSHNELITLLKRQKFSQGGVIHAFSGSQYIANTYIDLGFKLGVGGTITYPRALKTRQTISDTPLEHLLLETDAPDMPIMGYQGQINTPARLPLIAQALATLKSCELSEVVAFTTANYRKTFYGGEGESPRAL